MESARFWTTKQVSALLHIAPATLNTATWNGRLPEPQRVGKGFLWNAENIRQAAKLFKRDITGLDLDGK